MTTEEASRTPRFSRGKKFSLAGGIGAVALGIGAVVALPALTASPAFAVEPTDDGQIEVEVFSPEQAQELEETLAAHGIKAQVDFPPEGTMCDPDRYERVEMPGDTGLKAVVKTDDSKGVSVSFQVDPDDYPIDGDLTLVMELSKGYFDADKDGMLGAGLGAAKGEVGDCDPVEVEKPTDDGGTPPGGEKGTTEKKNDDGSKD